MSKFPADSKVKSEVSLEMGYCSGFASLGCGASLKQIQDGLHKALLGVDWDHTEDMFACVCSMLGEIFLRLSQEIQEKAI